MQNFNSVEEILEMAIKDEQRAANLYADLATRSRSDEMRRTFMQFSQEELGHKKKLERIKTGGEIVISDQKVQDARKIIIHAVIGLAIITVAYSISFFIVSNLENAASTDQKPNQQPTPIISS